MSRPWLNNAQRALLAVVLVLAGVVSYGVFWILSRSENHSYSVDATPPGQVRLTEGRTYELSTPGGVTALGKQVAAVAQCSWSQDGDLGQALTVQTTGDDKPTNEVGTFVAPVSGEVTILCPQWGPTFVDDADGAGRDPSGYFLLLAVLTLTAGGGLACSAGWVAYQARRSDGAGSAPADGGSSTGWPAAGPSSTGPSPRFE